MITLKEKGIIKNKATKDKYHFNERQKKYIKEKFIKKNRF